MSRENMNSVISQMTSDITGSIESGRLQQGDRLPTERELADKYDASRSVVRRALDTLEQNGRIIRHVGRGTFVAGSAGKLPKVVPELLELPDGGDVSPADLAVARLLIEPMITEYAAVQARMGDLEKIKDCLLKSEAAEDAAGFDYWDRELHTAIAAGAHNSFFMLIMEEVNKIRRTAEWGKVAIITATQSRREIHSRDHREIVDALFSRNAVAAREAMHRHLDNVNRLMRGGPVD